MGSKSIDLARSKVQDLKLQLYSHHSKLILTILNLFSHCHTGKLLNVSMQLFLYSLLCLSRHEICLLLTSSAYYL